MKIFVTGGAGFIGRHLTRSLLKGKNEITIYENFSSSTKNDVKDILKQTHLVKGDLTNFKLLQSSMIDSDYVIHLAAMIDVAESIKHPEKSHQVNVMGSINVLKACVSNRIKNIIAASSAATYGDPKTIPVSENTVPNPVSPYGADKLAMEFYVKAFCNAFGLNGISLRFFNVYGEGQTNAYAGVITKFMNKIERNKPLTIFGDGKNTRDYVYIDDLVQGINKAMKKIQGKKGDVYNIASGKSISVNELAKKMLSSYGKNLKIIHDPPRKGDLRHSAASISLAKKELGYLPKFSLEKGLKNILENRL